MFDVFNHFFLDLQIGSNKASESELAKQNIYAVKEMLQDAPFIIVLNGVPGSTGSRFSFFSSFFFLSFFYLYILIYKSDPPDPFTRRSLHFQGLL
jgi:hypothetical protein